jgi:radical SAM superfamily enzyme YgiQ (UPF0313 family)
MSDQTNLLPMTPSSEAGVRRILCVSPRYAPSFGTFEYAYELTDKAQAFMPPQGLLIIAAALPKTWEVRFIDENMERASEADFAWADAVFVSGMHIQRGQMQDICRRAHAKDKVVALGGPSVSACPENYPDFDYLHVGELGDATDELTAILARDVSRPERQVVLRTNIRRELSAFPMPSYELAKIDRYFLGTIQFSSGCPYQCEFCDIPGLYGRVARLKTPEQVLAELDRLLVLGIPGSVYFVDDNLLANRRALKELLPHLISWQKRNGYALSFACEATLNIARYADILGMMREAGFDSIFCGIETPEPDALVAIDKGQNMLLPILDAVRIINDHGMQVVSGIILGLDTDTPDTARKLLEFIDKSKIPMLTINLLQALPQTPLWDRLQRAGRLEFDEGRESNVRFELPYDVVLKMWRDCMAEAYTPEALFERYTHYTKTVWPNRLPRPNSPQRMSMSNIIKGLKILVRLLWIVGVCGDYRRTFWKFAWPLLRRGEIEALLFAALPAHHLIMFARDASSGRSNASHYSAKMPSIGAAAIQPR